MSIPETDVKTNPENLNGHTDKPTLKFILGSGAVFASFGLVFGGLAGASYDRSQIETVEAADNALNQAFADHDKSMEQFTPDTYKKFGAHCFSLIKGLHSRNYYYFIDKPPLSDLAANDTSIVEACSRSFTYPPTKSAIKTTKEATRAYLENFYEVADELPSLSYDEVGWVIDNQVQYTYENLAKAMQVKQEAVNAAHSNETLKNALKASGFLGLYGIVLMIPAAFALRYKRKEQINLTDADPDNANEA